MLCRDNFGHDCSRPLSCDYNPTVLKELNLPCDPLPIFLAFLPLSIKNLVHPKSIPQKKRHKLRLANIVAYEDANYRQRLAFARACGERLFFLQHGGNYGQIRYACLTAMVEYAQHCFGTWGWSKQGQEQGNFVVIPSPRLAKLHNTARPKDHLLFVGTEMPLYGYRLDSHPTPLQIVAYRQAKVNFLEHLGQALRAETYYRPYFPLPGSLEDACYLQKLWPKLKLCEGPLLPKLLSCRLLVLDHHGTTLLEAMAANVPLVLFFELKAWPVDADFAEFLKKMQSLGIFHDTPESCARYCQEIYPETLAWWSSQEVQELRQAFCQRYAQICPNPTKQLSSILKKL
ncbi:MAG: hypothetical protein IJS50_01265 [Desulfovibrio sp.]|nr:hypothetical protein [Desulfovibrio sp.]